MNIWGLNLKRRTKCNRAIPVPILALPTLGFLAMGTFRRDLSDRARFSSSYDRGTASVRTLHDPVCPRDWDSDRAAGRPLERVFALPTPQVGSPCLRVRPAAAAVGVTLCRA
ncbi:hypothetical protein SKAU_G00381830 [Synaphobranchus kaupii]|uniref:Uncharacterized protein n=1 Tax=Synaphobranchus kaupii TaxID=118154 RepID=A0A9Q1EDV2_SYNKA|nr:hypothetical protein SKAU_G00381830 [Synaphobranchus kaupii]